MARNTKILTIEKPGRDLGKTFLLTEMSPIQAFRWGAKAAIALVNAGVKLPEGAEDMGFAGLIGASFSQLTNGIAWEDVEPLLDELMACVKIIPNKSNPDITTHFYEAFIDEVSTIAILHAEVFKLHINFTQAGSTSG